MKLFITTVISILALSSCNDKTNNEIASTTKSTQVWATKNLDVDTFRNGEPIPEIESQAEFHQAGLNGKSAWCYYNGDSSNRSKYGKIYNWYAVRDSRGLAPQGWHIPSDSEWTILADYLGGKEIAGTKMKSKKNWDGDNSSGFNALPAGCSIDSNSYHLGFQAFFWSTTEYSSPNAWYRSLTTDDVQLYRGVTNEANGGSVRCIKD